MKSHYEHHIFICNNRREPGARPSCGLRGGDEARERAKSRIKKLGLNKPGKVRVNQAGCMERCEGGPCMVIYPQAVWYTFTSPDDIDEIIDRHVVGGEIVQRLLLKPEVPES